MLNWWFPDVSVFADPVSIAIGLALLAVTLLVSWRVTS